jgi:predicted MFS family arabinose efflux permease
VVPHRQPDHPSGYGRLLLSLRELVASEPVLRNRALCQACMFGAFTVYWTGIAYELTAAHHFTQDGIAVFALVGAAGAAAAPLAGRLGDRGYGRVVRPLTMLLAAVAFAVAGFGAHSVILLGLGGLLLDFAVQSHGVLNQRDIYALRDDARARINTVYMTTTFIGGAIASAVTGILHTAYGWTGVSVFGTCLALLALII